MKVLKFGGTSIGDATNIRRVCEIVASRASDPTVLVFSAMGSTTDRLVEIGELAAVGNADDSLKRVSDLQDHHRELVGELFTGETARGSVLGTIDPMFDRLREMVRSVAVLADLSPSVSARILGFGELLSTRVLAAFLGESGLRVEWRDARELIVTDENHLDAEPSFAETTDRVRARLRPLLDSGICPVTQGFIARSPRGTDTTLGRGGSDFTAALLGAALQAQEIEIWTDVDGVLTADPSLVDQARRIPVMSFQEAAELAFFGARVLHPKTLVPAVEAGIPVRVLNTLRPDGDGTVIVAEPEANGQPVKSIAYKEGMVLINLTSARMFGTRDFLRRIFGVFERYGISPHVVATSEVSVAVAIWDPSPLPQLTDELRSYGKVAVKPHQAVVCVVGERLKQTPGIVSQVFEALADVKTSLVSLGGSEINLGFVVDEDELPKVIRRLHRRFFEGESPA
jgi:aspartate kinase